MKPSRWEMQQTLEEMIEDGLVELISRDPKDSQDDRFRITPFGRWVYDQRMTEFVNLPKERKREIRKQFESGYR